MIAGVLDTLAATDDLRTVAAGIPQVRFLQLNGTHFPPLQYPDRLRDELRALVGRTDLDPAPAGPATRGGHGARARVRRRRRHTEPR